MQINTSAAHSPRRAPRTPLQKHVDFFDRNHDHQTTLAETYAGLRALGLGRLKSAFAGLVINGALAAKTGSPWYHPLTIQNDNIHMAKHDSDTDAYDPQGNFDPVKFAAIFDRFDANHDNALNKAELDTMIATNKESAAGNFGSKAEFGLLLTIAGQDKDGEKVLSRERLQSFYDGNLFYEIAGETPPAP